MGRAQGGKEHTVMCGSSKRIMEGLAGQLKTFTLNSKSNRESLKIFCRKIT